MVFCLLLLFLLCVCFLLSWGVVFCKCFFSYNKWTQNQDNMMLTRGTYGILLSPKDVSKLPRGFCTPLSGALQLDAST